MSTETSTSTPSAIRRWGGQLGQIAAALAATGKGQSNRRNRDEAD